MSKDEHGQARPHILIEARSMIEEMQADVIALEFIFDQENPNLVDAGRWAKTLADEVADFRALINEAMKKRKATK